MPNPLDDTIVYDLGDLHSWEKHRPELYPSLAVLGSPVDHSVSPQMHNAALAHLVMQGHEKLKDWRYFKFKIEPVQLEKAFDLLKEKNFQGVNLTVPLKRVAEMILNPPNINPARGDVQSDEIDTDVSGEALYVVNTVVFSKKNMGYNTDGFGMVQSLKSDLQVKKLVGRTVVILGIGGAASEAADECLRKNCAVLWVSSRDLKKRMDMEARLNEYIYKVLKAVSPNAPKVKGFDFTAPPIQDWPEDVIIINATTLGMKSDDPLPFDVSRLGKNACVFDMVYNRQRPTKFVEAASARGLRATDGLSMLVWQGAKSLSIWLQSQAGLHIQPEEVAPTMMSAACQALGLPPRHA